MNFPFSLTPLADLDGAAILPLAEAKEHLRVIDDDEDALITAIVQASADWVETESGLSLIQRNWRFECDAFPTREEWFIELPMGPVSIVSVKYLEATGGTQITMASGDYRLGRSRIEPGLNKSWPTTAALSGAVEITYLAGVASVPQPLLAAIKLMAGHLYINRGETCVEPPAVVSNLIHQYRRMIV